MEAFLAGFGKAFSPDDPAFLFMYVIAFFAAASLAIGIERFYYIMIRSNINADKFMAEIRKLVAGGNMDRAIALCDKGKQKALPFVVLRGLKRAIESEALDFRAIQNAVDEGTLEVIPKLQERTNYLSMFANVATLTGLMGTIFGLIIAFDAVGGEGIPEADKTRYLAAGISAAMNTTIFGLMVAIPSLIIYTYLTNQTTKIIDEMDEHLVKLINLITGNR
jgi:biopolymer transport protein ExbB/TolQ